MATHAAVRALASTLLVPPFRAAVRYGPQKRAVWQALRSLSWQPHSFEANTLFGFKFAGNTCDPICRYIYYFGIWEPVITRWIRSLPLHNRSVIDIGGHLGWYSLLTSPLVGPQGRVITIEANPANHAGLARNVEINRLKNVSVIHAAAWNKKTELELHFSSKSGTGMSSVMESFRTAYAGQSATEYDTAVEVQAVPAATFIEDHDARRAALVKIDVEGAEAQALEGLEPAFEKFPNDVCVLMEYSPEGLSVESRRQISDIFTRFGFKPYRIPNAYSPEFYLEAVEHAVAPQVQFQPVGPLSSVERQTDLVFSRVPLGA